MTTYKELGPRLFDLGYEPLPIIPGKKWPAEEEWQKIHITSDWVAGKAANGAGSWGIGVRTGTGVIAIYAADFDFYDKDVTKRVYESFTERFGQAPVRVGQAPKALAVYSGAPGQAKMQAEFVSQDGKAHKFELLGAGQQFVAYGIHPDTGKPYKWVTDPIDTVETWELPELDFNAVAEWMRDTLPGLVPDDWQAKSASAAVRARGDGDAFETYKAPIEGWDIDRIRDEIAPHLDIEADYDTWLSVGMAIHHQTGGSDDGFELWDSIYKASSKYGTRRYGLSRWKSFGDYSGERLTLASLIKQVAPKLRLSALDKHMAAVANASDAAQLQTEVCKAIAADRTLMDVDLVRLEKLVQDKARELLGTKPAISLVRDWLQPPMTAGGFVDLTDEGKPLTTIENVEVVLQRMEATVRYNVMTKEDEILIRGKSFSIDNKAAASLTHIVSECSSYNMHANTGNIKPIVTAIADANQYNPVMTWITSKPWDGVSRLQALCDTLVVDEEHLAMRDMVVRKWVLTAVYAAAEPEGIAPQGMLVLVGEQYKGKSRWFKSLVEDPTMVREGHTLDPKDKDSVKQALSAWITELGELDATFRKADIAALKAFVTKQYDVLRKPYAAAESNFARRTVFAGTVNDENYLRDPTGNRRFWTVKVLDVVHEHGIDMQQLWAEVYETMYIKREPHWMTVEQMAALNDHNQDFTEINIFEELLLSRLDWDVSQDQWREITATDLAVSIGIEPGRGGAIGVSLALKKLGGKKHRTNKKRAWLVPPEKIGREFLE